MNFTTAALFSFQWVCFFWVLPCFMERVLFADDSCFFGFALRLEVYSKSEASINSSAKMSEQIDPIIAAISCLTPYLVFFF